VIGAVLFFLLIRIVICLEKTREAVARHARKKKKEREREGGILQGERKRRRL
jgi:hypothetical protein